MKNFLLILFTSLCLIKNSKAQTEEKYIAIAQKIDSLSLQGLPKSALEQVNHLEKLARLEKNLPQQIKAVMYRITFMSYLEEDALEAVILSLRQDVDHAVYPVKPVLQSLLAEIYWRYYQQNRYQVIGRSVLEKPDPDFTRWDLKTLIHEVSTLYKKSLQNASTLQSTSVGVLDGVLAGDEATKNR